MFNIKRIAMALSIMAVVGLTGALMAGLVSASDTIVLNSGDNSVPSPRVIFMPT